MPKGVKGFQKGKSGNPNGRPKTNKTIAECLRRIGDEALPSDKSMTKLEAIMRKVYKIASEGDAWAVNFIADRTEGKPKQIIEQVGDAFPEVNLTVIPNKEKGQSED